MKYSFILFSFFVPLFEFNVSAFSNISLNSDSENNLEQLNCSESSLKTPKKFTLKQLDKEQNIPDLSATDTTVIISKSRPRSLSAPPFLESPSSTSQSQVSSNKIQTKRTKLYARQLILNLLEHGLDLNKTYQFNTIKQTPLIHLIGHEYNTPLIKSLLKKGANPNIGTVDYSPLEIAIISGNFSVIEALLEHGACPEGGIVGKITPLQYVIIKNQPRIVEILLRFGADPNLCKKNGKMCKSPDQSLLRQESPSTPLSETIKRNVCGLTFILLAHGADPLIKDNLGKTSADYLSKSTLKHEYYKSLSTVKDHITSILTEYLDNNTLDLAIQYLYSDAMK